MAVGLQPRQLLCRGIAVVGLGGSPNIGGGITELPAEEGRDQLEPPCQQRLHLIFKHEINLLSVGSKFGTSKIL